MKGRVTEIRVKRIRVNQGVSVTIFRVYIVTFLKTLISSSIAVVMHLKIESSLRQLVY